MFEMLTSGIKLMKKSFFLFSLVIFCFSLCTAQAAVSTLGQAAEMRKETKSVTQIPQNALPDPDNVEEVRAFFKERFENAVVSTAEEIGDLGMASAINIQHSAEYIAQMQEEKKSVFEKIYDKMMGRIDEPQKVEFSPETIFYELAKEEEHQNAILRPDIAVVKVKLPNNKEVLAPAQEHIPYLLASYHILPTGSVEVVEDIVVVANGQKLKNGFIKLMPKRTKSRAGVEKKIEIELLDVTINGKPVEHKLIETGKDIMIAPKEKYSLTPGVYTYRYHYLLDRKLWYYDDFTEFYNDVTGSYLNLVITSANAIVSVPDGRTFHSQVVMIGRAQNLSNNRAVVASLDQNALGFASSTPLNSGEGMHILVSLDKDIFLKPSLSQRFIWLIGDFGDVLFALVGLLCIFISYYLSFKNMKKTASGSNISLKHTAALNRYILQNKYDTRVFVSALLDLVRYKMIDIASDKGEYVIIKKTDRLKNVPASLKSIVQTLFLRDESSVEINAKNALKFDRAKNKHAKRLKMYFSYLKWSSNISYLLFSLGMLVLTVIAISYLAINPWETMFILSAAVATLAFYLWVFNHTYQNKKIKYLMKTLSGIFTGLTILFLSVYIHLLAAVFLSIALYVILMYSKMFLNYGGLIRSKVLELEKLKQYLKDNASKIASSFEFEKQQADIFGFELEELYPLNEQNQNVYRLSLAKAIQERL